MLDSFNTGYDIKRFRSKRQSFIHIGRHRRLMPGWRSYVGADAFCAFYSHLFRKAA